MASVQKRWLTQPNSKVGKVPDLPAVLRDEAAWSTLKLETRQALYALLPEVREGDAPLDPNIHPLHTPLKPYIEEELRNWQTDLNDGKEAKKWREDAFRAGKERASGAWDEWTEKQREADWGKREESTEPQAKLKTEKRVTEEVAREAGKAAAGGETPKS